MALSIQQAYDQLTKALKQQSELSAHFFPPCVSLGGTACVLAIVSDSKSDWYKQTYGIFRSYVLEGLDVWRDAALGHKTSDLNELVKKLANGVRVMANIPSQQALQLMLAIAEHARHPYGVGPTVGGTKPILSAQVMLEKLVTSPASTQPLRPSGGGLTLPGGTTIQPKSGGTTVIPTPNMPGGGSGTTTGGAMTLGPAPNVTSQPASPVGTQRYLAKMVGDFAFLLATPDTRQHFFALQALAYTRANSSILDVTNSVQQGLQGLDWTSWATETAGQGYGVAVAFWKDGPDPLDAQSFSFAATKFTSLAELRAFAGATQQRVVVLDEPANAWLAEGGASASSGGGSNTTLYVGAAALVLGGFVWLSTR